MRRLEDRRTRMLSFTGQGRKTLDEMRTHFLRFHQCHSSKFPRPNTYPHAQNLREKSPRSCGPQSAANGDFFTQGLTQRAGTSSAVPTLWSGCPLFRPSWLCLSTMGEAANCQLLCPHYPRPPAQTGALGHCPRNHSAPVASQES